ncbi:PorP/SprF family type IX secretion system membrane protein [Maribacter sp. 2307ULW6-5]|uniref:PorP/SprF family type IX secretion system membrane protein n=1 Tax=Maribacter sp. 2307ULW6-5 TaxID=3386275 RepID=UPI0039BC8985
MQTKRFLYLFLFLFSALGTATAQEDSPFVVYDVPAQNLLKYNRFLINPTFSTVREDKSYINLLHRNQSVQFSDNNQNYFLSYSGRINDRTGLGLSLYTQQTGTISNFGVLANYAYGVRLNEKSNLTFGANVSYYNSGFDEGRAITVEEDPFLAGFQDQNLLSLQPGINLSYGQFDVGVFAENLFDYNLRTNQSLTAFQDKTFSGHLQYTHQFKNTSGVLAEGRLMPLARVRKVGSEELTLGGSLIMDLPKLGWVQAGYDSFYGAAAGVGFNLNRRISLGYTMEKGLSNNFDNFGVTHEISFAYSFTPNLTEDRVLLEEDSMDEMVFQEALPEEEADDEDIALLKQRLAENDAIIQELMFRQDSLEANRQQDLERRFNMVMRMVRNETQGQRPDLEQKAAEIFSIGDQVAATSGANNSNDGGAANLANTSLNQTVAVTRNGAGENPKTNASNTRQPSPANGSQNPVATKVTRPTTPKAAATPSRPQAQDAVAVAKTEASPTVQDRTLQRKAIKNRKFTDLPEANNGYYVIANVYKGQEYLNRFLTNLKDKGVDANYLDNPNNGLKYVYLDRYETLEEAEAAITNNRLNGYEGATWIMNVDNRYSNEAYAANVDKLNKRADAYDTDVLRTNVVVQDKLVAEKEEPQPLDLGPGGDGSQYYIIANVFANPKNANRFVSLLNSYGLSASYFINPENNYRYVYLKRHASWNNALLSYYTNLNDAYNDKMWIMKVNPQQLAA